MLKKRETTRKKKNRYISVPFVFLLFFTMALSSGISVSADVYELALEKYRTGNFSEAIKILDKKAAKSDGEYNLLGWAYLKSGNPDRAIKEFELSLAIDPHDNDSSCGIGYAHLQLGQLDKSLEYFNRGVSDNKGNVDCLAGLALTRERVNDIEGALGIYREILSVDKNNLLAKEKLDSFAPRITRPDDEPKNEFFAIGNYFWVKRPGQRAAPVFIKGVNVSFAIPGKFPAEFPEDEQLYREWFELISEMNANTIRVYTILPPQFYNAFRKFNENQKNKRLYLIHGIWAELPEKSDFRDQSYDTDIKNEIKNAVDVIHGKAVIPHRYGHAFGTYTADISEYVMGFIFGREWEPPDVIAFNSRPGNNSYNGKFLQINDANPMEVWLTEMLDYLLEYESNTYHQQRPSAIMNWPPLDPLFHPTEATFKEQVVFRKQSGEIFGAIDYTKAFDEDAVSIDETKIVPKETYTNGIFASYHVYPYYPDFLRYDEAYGKGALPGGSTYYYNYLLSLKKHYKNIPLLISEFGLSTSRGIARYHPENLNHGGLSEYQQADGLKRLITSIKEAECAGGIVFAWIDEWVKKTWMVKGMEERDELWFNALDPEESYGLIAMAPKGIDKLKGNANAWDEATVLYSKASTPPVVTFNDKFDGARTLRQLSAASDAGYLYLKLDIGGAIDWDNVAYLIALDTFGDKEGDHSIPLNANLISPIGFEFILILHGKQSRLLIDDLYNRTVFDTSLLRFPGLSGYKDNESFKMTDNKNGLFTELLTIHPKRFSREGKIFPEKVYNASTFIQGNLSDDTGSDFYYSKEGNFIEIRIPWSLLYFSDPSRSEVLYSQSERKITRGIRMMAFSYKPLAKGNINTVSSESDTTITDMIPSGFSHMTYYAWPGWDSPAYTSYKKRAYFVMQETFQNMENPEFRLSIPGEYNFSSVVKTHYGSLKEFETLYRKSLNNVKNSDFYGRALAHLTLGLVTDDPFHIAYALSLLQVVHETELDPAIKNMALQGILYIDSMLHGYIGNAANSPEDTPESVSIRKTPAPSGDFTKLVIGKSAIHLSKDSKILSQTDRVTRDWMMAYNITASPWTVSTEHIVPWHEGEKIKEIVDYTEAEIVPIWGVKAKKLGKNWYAPDKDGVFRFVISEDKVLNYPTNFIVDPTTVFINDTHGISVLAGNPTAFEADLAVGCGDYPGKIEAAYYLADNGVNVYMPTDRFVYQLIGAETKGTIIGSAPIKKTPKGAVIGGQPIVIDIREPIIVSNSQGGYPLQYYDTPYRYFQALGTYVGKQLNLVPVEITEYGKAWNVIDKARQLGSRLIGIRVWGKAEHDAVSAWLRENKNNRAVLFHSAVYPEGYRLFFEFPDQTSFGDIHVSFEK
jgi:tetratricopeptide (TPR) repeat protein